MESCHDLLPVSTELSLVLGSLAMARGEWEQAERHLAGTGVATPDNAFTPVAIAAHGMITIMRLATDDVEAANAEADRGIELLRRKGVWAWAGEITPAALAAYCRAGRLDDATTLIAELESATTGVDAPLVIAALDMCRAELAVARGDLTAAIKSFEQARIKYDRLPCPYLALMATERARSSNTWRTSCASSACGPGASYSAVRREEAPVSRHEGDMNGRDLHTESFEVAPGLIVPESIGSSSEPARSIGRYDSMGSPPVSRTRSIHSPRGIGSDRWSGTRMKSRGGDLTMVVEMVNRTFPIVQRDRDKRTRRDIDRQQARAQRGTAARRDRC